MMKYGVRVGIGALLGILLAVGLTLWLDQWWIGALAGGLGGPIAFLATFFIWSADRLDEGYEQVLFDQPNTVLSGIMIVAFVGAAFGTSLVGWSSDAPAAPRELAAIGTDYQTTSEEYHDGKLDATTAAAKMQELVSELERSAASDARDWLLKAAQAQLACIEAGATACPEAFDSFIEYRLSKPA